MKKGIGKAKSILSEKIDQIDRVSEWAEECGYSCSKKFSKEFRNYHGERPSKFMIKLKLEKAIELLSNGEGLSNYDIAREIGKKDDDALNHFVRGQTGHPPKFYKRKIRVNSHGKLSSKNGHHQPDDSLPVCMQP